MRCGILVIDKDSGWTSHDVVNKLRGIFGQKKIGHTGTLDPMATGVLPICLGRATKLADYVADGRKTYAVEMTLGKETDTEDITGTVLRCRTDFDVSNQSLEKVMSSFCGPQEQIPPMYSAIRINGKRLYEIARTGRTINRPPRPIEIYSLTMTRRMANRIQFVVECSKGTYVRSLCRDIGRALGSFAVMSALRRTRVGPFTLTDAMTLPSVEARGPEQSLMSPDVVLQDLPALTVRSAMTNQVNNGNPLAFSHIVEKDILDGTIQGALFRVYRSDGVFAGLYERAQDRIKPRTILIETGRRKDGVESSNDRFVL